MCAAKDGHENSPSHEADESDESAAFANPSSSKTSNTSTDNADDVEPGMAVEASEGDLGEHDVSTARVTDVERDEKGDVTNVVVEKGVIFRKKIEIPAERIEAVEAGSGEASERTREGREGASSPKNQDESGKVVVSAS